MEKTEMANKTNKEANIKIGRMLQSCRESKDVTQADIVKSTGMSKNQISAIECGQSKASVELLLGYCRKLGMTPNDILGFRDNEILPELQNVLSEMDTDEQRKILSMIRLMRS